MTSILQAMGYIQDQADAGQKKGLARLLGSAYGAAPEQRQQILGTVAQRGGADMAFEADKHFAGMEDGARKRLGQDAAVLLALPADQRAQAYPGFAAKAQQLGIPAPMQWDDKFATGLGQLATALGGAKAADTPNSVQEYLYAQNHPGFQEFLNGRQATQLTSIPVPGGMMTVQWNPRTKQMTDLQGNPVGADGSAVQMNNGPQQSDVTDVSILPGANVPEGDAGAILAAAQNPGKVFAPQGGGAPAGRIGFKPDKPADVPDSFTTLTSSEVAQAGLPAGTFAQRNNKTGEIKVGPAGVQPKSDKPLPPNALRLIKDETDAMDAAGTMNMILNRAKGRIENGSLNLSFFGNMGAKARNFTGANDESSRNYQTFISDLNRARNQSLLLNKGVQTEGDAQRAWDELLSNVNDEKLVLQRIKEIEEINARAIRLRRANVDMIRANYGADPMDFSARENAAPSAPASGGNVIRYDAQGNRIK